jgi:hypothetical protein
MSGGELLTMENLGWLLLVSPVLLWLCFVPLFWVLGRAHVEKRGVTGWEHAVAIPALLIGWPLDVLVNLTWGTVLFLQWPHYQRLLLSPRMDDHILNGSGWRKELALFIVGTFLEPFDKTGQHSTYGKLP